MDWNDAAVQMAGHSPSERLRSRLKRMSIGIDRRERLSSNWLIKEEISHHHTRDKKQVAR